jgi:sugar (pentulose or hexulose) kinase
MTDAAGLCIGLDLGTSGLKGIALDQVGRVVARARSDYPTHRPAANAAEQSPRDWLSAIENVAGQLAARAAPDRWRAIGLSAMIPTLVTVGADGEPIGPAITWQDSRAQAQAERLIERCGADYLYQVTGQRLDGRYLLPMFLRLAEAEPQRAAQTTAVLGAKDFLFGLLTGLAATDPSTAAGYGCYQLTIGGWDDRILSAAAELTGHHGQPGPPLPALPPVLPTTTTRPLRPQAASWLGCGQIPVCLGAADSVLGALGLGITDPGHIAYVAGTSTVILGVTERLLLDPQQRFLVTPMAEPGRWGLEMDLLATGSALRWLAALLGDGMDEAALVALAAGTDPADAPTVLPYLSPGEQGALWDPLLHGTVTGLTFDHGRPHLARGLVNGIVLEARRCLTVLDETGQFSAELRVAGGGADEPAFRADLADATGRRVVMPAGQDPDFSARGAALLAARSVGQLLAGQDAASGHSAANDGDAEVASWQPLTAVSEPDHGRAARWDRLWTDYERARLAITSHYHGPKSLTTGDGFARGPVTARHATASQPSHSASSLVTVAQLRAVPAATWPFGRISNAVASPLRPKPSGVCRYRIRPTRTASSRLPRAAASLTASSTPASTAGSGSPGRNTACTRLGSGSAGYGLRLTTVASSSRCKTMTADRTLSDSAIAASSPRASSSASGSVVLKITLPVWM